MDYPKAGNWQKSDNFCWSDKPSDAEEWLLYHYLTRDSTLIEQSNAFVIEKIFEGFPDSEVRYERFTHWACGWVDALAIREQRAGKPTQAYLKLCEVIDRLRNYVYQSSLAFPLTFPRHEALHKEQVVKDRNKIERAWLEQFIANASARGESFTWSAMFKAHDAECDREKEKEKDAEIEEWIQRRGYVRQVEQSIDVGASMVKATSEELQVFVRWLTSKLKAPFYDDLDLTPLLSRIRESALQILEVKGPSLLKEEADHQDEKDET